MPGLLERLAMMPDPRDPRGVGHGSTVPGTVLAAESTVRRLLPRVDTDVLDQPGRGDLARRPSGQAQRLCELAVGFSGMVCGIPRLRRYWRQGPLLQALSAAMLSGVLRGLPGPGFGTRIFSLTADTTKPRLLR